MHYKFRENGKTMTLHIHEEVVNSCSLKLKVNQVDSLGHCRTKVFLMEKLLPEEPGFYNFLCLVSTHWKIRALLQQLVPKGPDDLLLVLSPTKRDSALAVPSAAAVYAINTKNTP